MTRKRQAFLNGVLVEEIDEPLPPAVERRDAADQALKGLRPQLKTWAQEADADADGYGAMTAAQRNAANERAIRRAGRLARVLRHALLLLDLDQDDGEG